MRPRAVRGGWSGRGDGAVAVAGVVGRRVRLYAAAGACALVAYTLAASSPADALSQRGHSFGFSFASKGEGDGKLKSPAGVAVNESSGDVYVVDASNNRIERFGSRGEFIAAWGWGVADGEAKYEVCSSSCRGGIAGEGAAQLDSPTAIAVDNSTSSGDPSREDVYVLSDTVAQNNVVEKFAPSGAPIGRLQMKTEASGTLGGVAVDSGGQLWVSDLSTSEVAGFNDAPANEPLPSSVDLGGLECAEAPGLAVDSGAERFYLGHQLESLEGECPESIPSPKAPALIAQLGGKGEVLSNALDQENTSAVAVDLASGESSPLGQAAHGNVYLDNQTSIAVFNAAGSFIQRFGSAELLTKGSGIAIDSKTGDVYVTDAKANAVDVFEPEAVGPPQVDRVSARNLSPTSTRLEAQIDPAGADTHYFFEYGTADCRATPSSCTDLPAPPGEDLGSGFASLPASATADGLQPGTTYFYRVIASNAKGETEGSQTLHTFTTLPSSVDVLADGRAWELVSPPDKHGAVIYPIGGTSEDSAPGVGVIEASQDGSAITYAANAPLGSEPPGNRAFEAVQVLSKRDPERWSTRDIPTPHDKAEGVLAGTPQEYRAFSPDVSLGLVQPNGLFGTHLQEPPLVQGLETEERGIYLRHDATCEAAPATCYEPLITPQEDTTKARFGGEVEFAGASSNLQHVVFSSSVAISSSSPSGSGLYEWNAGKPPTEALQLVSVLPGNKKSAEESQLGDFIPQVSAVRNAVSSDGSRVVWSAVTEEGEAAVTNLFMRDTTHGQTIRLNAAQGVKELPPGEREKQEVHFRSANADGSMVFFTDTFPLTAESKLRASEEGPADLYVCEVSEGLEGPKCTLKDLTIDPASNFGESADVVGTLPGASEDGSSVYFVANGVLDAQAQAAGAVRGQCARPSVDSTVPGATCNLYLEHYDQESKEWEAPRFIARLSQEDQPDWGSKGTQALGTLSSRVSPNGHYLAFMSREPLTGYDNVDSSEEAHGARDEEVYVYDAQDESLVCASCNPSGNRPTGIFDHERIGEGRGLLVDRPGIWQETEGEEKGGARRPLDHWLAGSIPGWTPVSAETALYQSRYLSDEGRLFFNSPEALVSHDTNGKEDVYQFEPVGVGSCASASGCISLISSGESDHESAFLDASASGNDAFFLTNRQLVAADQDASFDVYDARVCSVSSPCQIGTGSSSQPCEALQTCRPVAVAQPAFPGPSGSATLSGPGNSGELQALGANAGKKPETRGQKLAKALRSCRRKHRAKKRRAACERQARKRYAPSRPHNRHTKARKRPGVKK